MKNAFKVLGIIAIVAVIGFSFIACEEEEEEEKGDTSTSGRLTITNLTSYNNWKIISMGNAASGLVLTAENNSDEWARPTVSGGSVTVYVWKSGGSPSSKKSYSGNDQNVVFNITLSQGDSINYKDGTVTVTFTNGVGSGAFVPSP